MSLRHALLALLEAGPMTGYELAKQFDQSADRVWHAPHPQIYTELRKLEREDLVAADEVARGTKAVKRAYRLTEAGERELRRWVSEVEAPSPVRDAAYLKATYFEYADPEVVRRQFEAHRAHHQEQLHRWERHAAQLRARETELLQRRLAHAPQPQHEAIVAYKVHVYEGMAERARAEIAWAERGLALVEKLG
ncbi:MULTISPECIES: PadR family transcriptional regulator [Amycolatopsis]|uniref:PadR family transcriptional regulator, regulatory protein AphA n=2 Tax=Amycolatopsis TaxID=1813 RepID=A0A1I4CSI8_9PSEU|nr:PadR family transcriptional regulator [Amycolatopsis sacchari]SFK83753.1 PadR family transcriptional regulator, regulatory protein AphA [Amycolatopsis sacchari]